jgi:hypothetical protein
VLEAAGLISTVRHGREKLHSLNPVPLHEIYERWTAKFERPDLEALTSMKKRLEQETHTMDKPKLVYVTYIATTPEQLWNALTDPELTARYWGDRNVSSWTKGDGWEHRRLDGDSADVVGTILEVDPPRRLATPDQAEGTSQGWAIVLASLKSLLETGRPLSSLL